MENEEERRGPDEFEELEFEHPGYEQGPHDRCIYYPERACYPVVECDGCVKANW